MDIRHLEYFVEVARHLSFTKASRNLHVSQPSISKMVKALEDELGVPLFYRSSKQIQLTDAGRAVLGQAQHILYAFNNLTSELSDVIKLKKGIIKIGLPPIIGASFFPKIIGQFKAQYPMIDIQLTEVGTKKIEWAVEEGTLDIGIVCSLPIKKDVFEIHSFFKDPLLLVVNSKHELCKKEKVAFKDLEEETFVLYREDFSLHDRIVDKCNEKGFNPKVICESSQRDFMVEMVANGLGIALLPERICRELDSTKVKSIPFAKPEIFLELSTIWKKDKYLSFAARQWVHYTRDSLNC